jgi:hypothetical protein
MSRLALSQLMSSRSLGENVRVPFFYTFLLPKSARVLRNCAIIKASFRFTGNGREHDRKRAPFAEFAFDADCPTLRFDNSLSERQT